MDRLAESRAKACLGALVQKGIAGERLFVTYKGRGGNVRVDFRLRSVNPYGTMPADGVAPLGLVYQGQTATRGVEVVCPMPEGAALYVDEQYVLQVPHLPEVLSLDQDGSVAVADVCLRSAFTDFDVQSESLPDFVVKARLLLALIETAGVGLLARYVQAGTSHWSAPLPLPLGMSFAIYNKGADVPIQNGNLEPTAGSGASAQVPPAGFVLGSDYEVRITPSDAVVETRQPFVAVAEQQVVMVAVERKTAEVRVRWAWAAGSRYEHPPLPSAVPYRLMHKGLQVEVNSGVLRCSTNATTKDEQLRRAGEQISGYIRNHDVYFNGASDPALPKASQAWNIRHMDDEKWRQNEETIQGIADIMKDFPDLGLQVAGQAASKTGQSAPDSLAEFFHLRAREDHEELMTHLARERAKACSMALQGFGVDPRRLVVTARGNGNEMKTDFIPLEETVLRRMRQTERAAQRQRDEVAARVARKKVTDFMVDNDVFFNGARERATKESRLGIEQAWNIDNLDPQKRAQNWKTIEGIAKILADHRELSCEVMGQTTKAREAEPLLARYFNLDPKTQVQEVMDRLGMKRAQACREALQKRLVELGEAQQTVPARFTASRDSELATREGARPWPEERVWSKGRAGEMKVDFIPKVHSSQQADDSTVCLLRLKSASLTLPLWLRAALSLTNRTMQL